MNRVALADLKLLVQQTRIAALATLRQEYPVPSMIPIWPTLDLPCLAFVFRASTLAHHTQDFLADPRAGLLLTQPDEPGRDPSLLARLSMHGRVAALHDLAASAESLDQLQRGYLARFPGAAITLGLGDFATYLFEPLKARFIAGPGKIFDLTAPHLTELLREE